jgi:hypothetical protein
VTATDRAGNTSSKTVNYTEVRTASKVAIFGHTGFVSPSGVAGVFLGCFSGGRKQLTKQGQLTVAVSVKDTDGPTAKGNITLQPFS